jgi:hypothetical protein
MKNIARTQINGTTVTTLFNGIAYITQSIGGARDGESSVSFDEQGARGTHARYVAAAR